MSIYSKPQTQFMGVSDGSVVGGGVLRMPLNRDDLTVEHVVNVTLEHSASVAPTGASDALVLIEKLEIETERGIEFTTNGFDLARLNEVTQAAAQQRENFGLVTTIMFALDVFSVMAGASHDLLTAIESGQRAKYNLILTLAKDASAVLTGGTLTGGPKYTVNVEAKTYPELTGAGMLEGDYAGIASLVHRCITNTKPGSTSGQLDPIQLTSAGGLLRFLQLSCFDVTGAIAVVSDDIVDAVRIVAGGREVFSSTFKAMQSRNERQRNLSRMGSGVAFADYGDDVNEWLDMGDVKDARLFLTVAAGAPAGYEIRVSEDFVSQS